MARTTDESENSKEALYITKRNHADKYKPVNAEKHKEIVCYKCKKPGHHGRDCRSRVDRGRQRYDTRTKRNDEAFLVSLNTIDVDEAWVLDSGSTHHVCKRREWFSTFRELDSEIVNTAANPSKHGGAILTAKGIGNVVLKTSVNGIRKNLMSVSRIGRKEKQLTFKNGKVTIWNMITKRIVCEANRINDLYVVNAQVEHQRLCYTSQEVIKNMMHANKVRDLSDTKDTKFVCDACCIGKGTKAPCKRLKDRQSKDVCELIYSVTSRVGNGPTE
ncbi:uncharacterized protein LOC143214128 [Lasioglossum baleicum]|uniref:uncharacterized protein LOC143214128 n=1 Tax=Lasioglossum baleicum TaxID=434251 RepID=UPI003FCC600E